MFLHFKMLFYNILLNASQCNENMISIIKIHFTRNFLRTQNYAKGLLHNFVLQLHFSHS